MLRSSVVVLALLCSPGAAAAATVSVGQKEDVFGATFKFAGRPGEASTTRFAIGPKSIAVSDSSADLVAGHGCVAQDARHVVCRSRRSSEWTSTLRLGDSDDSAAVVAVGRSSGGRVIVYGGRGDDRINAARVSQYGFFYGGPGNDTILGTSDGDVLAGGAGRDSLHGRAGADSLHPDAAGTDAGDDFIDGGAGEDSVTYAGRTRSVLVDLRRAAPQGAASERDTFVGIEDATGGAGDDVLLGNNGDNDLDGSRGRDRVEGFGGDDRVWGRGGGPDQLVGGDGADVVIADGGGTGTGGPGDDEVSGRGATLSGGIGDDAFAAVGGTVACNEGDDSVSLEEPVSTLLQPGCESLTLGGAQVFFVSGLPQREEPGVRVRISCDDEDGSVGLCKGRFAVEVNSQVVAEAAYNVSGGRSKTLHAPFSAGGAEALGPDLRRVRVSFGSYAFEIFL
ncbi:MAG: calcium-binding protein [Solirubrobacteraceae bacterium]